jgi:hypothetical protein
MIGDRKMGTNYYLEYNHCKKCNRLDEIHIGKKSYGWSFGFHGVKKDDVEDEREEIKSWQDWKKKIQEKGCIIRNEYNETVSAKEFIKIVETSKKNKSNLNHYIEMKKEGFKMRGEWLDEEGYSFSEGEFS